MDAPLVGYLVALGALSLLMSWFTGSLLKRHARQDGEEPSEWIPFSVLPYAFRGFRHRRKFAILWGYIFSNGVFLGVLLAAILLRNRTPS